MKYSYPAIFSKEKDNTFSISFPDIPNCNTCGDNITDGLAMAEDALALALYSFYEEKNIEVPKPSEINSIKLKDNEFVSFIYCDTLEYEKMFSNKSVKKTLTIPEWLDNYANKAGINFSQTLQDALKQKLGVG